MYSTFPHGTFIGSKKGKIMFVAHKFVFHPISNFKIANREFRKIHNKIIYHCDDLSDHNDNALINVSVMLCCHKKLPKSLTNDALHDRMKNNR